MSAELMEQLEDDIMKYDENQDNNLDLKKYHEAQRRVVLHRYSQTILLVYQEEWQRDLMNRYGKHLIMLDATHRTTKYELPLFFLCVKTNVGYVVRYRVFNLFIFLILL